MTPLDTLVTTKELQIIKSLLPYFPSSQRSLLAVYLKFMEFQTTFKLFSHMDSETSEELIGSKTLHSPIDLLSDLKNYLSPDDAAAFDSILNAFQMMDTFQENPFSSDPSGSAPSGNYADMLNQFDTLLKGMEQKNERMDESSGNEKH